MKKQLKSVVKIGFVATWMVSLAACSSSKTSSEDVLDIIPEPTADAGTDAVPLPDPELASADPEVPALDEASKSDPAVAEATPPAPEAVPEPAETVASTEPVVAAPIPVAASEENAMDSYTTSEGDTLMRIAFETYGDLYQWKRIYEDNRDQIPNPNAIPAGTHLKLRKPASPVSISRNGEKYLIKPGDTLGRISDDVYGTEKKWKRLWENNKELIHDPNRIFAGFYLYYTMTPEDHEEYKQFKGEVSTRLPAGS